MEETTSPNAECRTPPLDAQFLPSLYSSAISLEAEPHQSPTSLEAIPDHLRDPSPISLEAKPDPSPISPPISPEAANFGPADIASLTRNEIEVIGVETFRKLAKNVPDAASVITKSTSVVTNPAYPVSTTTTTATASERATEKAKERWLFGSKVTKQSAVEGRRGVGGYYQDHPPSCKATTCTQPTGGLVKLVAFHVGGFGRVLG